MTLLDTGLWRNIGERLWAVREQVEATRCFLANYSDGLTDVRSGRHDRAVQEEREGRVLSRGPPPLTFHLADIDVRRHVKAFRTSDRSDIWINGGYFILRPEIFNYMWQGEELVVEPFRRLIDADQLLAYKYHRLLAGDGYAARPAEPGGHGGAG